MIERLTLACIAGLSLSWAVLASDPWIQVGMAWLMFVAFVGALVVPKRRSEEGKIVGK